MQNSLKELAEVGYNLFWTQRFSAVVMNCVKNVESIKYQVSIHHASF